MIRRIETTTPTPIVIDSNNAVLSRWASPGSVVVADAVRVR